jgi:hypothetical protein
MRKRTIVESLIPSGELLKKFFKRGCLLLDRTSHYISSMPIYIMIYV